jgi:colanic acid biosynthesis glycosyl transferase WcaI
LVIGDGAGLSALREKVRVMGLSNVLFRPYQPRSQLHLSLSAIDVHLISLHPQLEGLIVPSKVYGVLAAGRASELIGDGHGDAGRLLLNSGAGMVCASNDEQALYDTLRYLHFDAARRERMGKIARALLCERYDQRHALASWQDVLDGR